MIELEKLYQEAYEAQDPKVALFKYRKLLKELEAQMGAFDLKLCTILSQISGVEYDIDEYEKSIESAKRCLTILAFHKHEDYILRSQLCNNIAIGYWMLEKNKEAQEHFEILLQVLVKSENKDLFKIAIHDYKNFCFQVRDFDKLAEIANLLEISYMVYTYLKNQQPVIFEQNVIFCCTDPEYAEQKPEFELGKVVYFQLIPLSMEHGATLSFDKKDKGREPLEEFSKSFTMQSKK